MREGGGVVKLTLSASNIRDYETFLRVKQMPKYSVVGSTVEFPDEYAAMLGIGIPDRAPVAYVPHKRCFDYQRAISKRDSAQDEGIFSGSEKR